MNTGSLSPRRLVPGLTALVDKSVRLSSTPTGEFLVAGITAPTLVVLAAWLGSALGVPLVLNLAVATTLGLALVMPYMRKEMPFSTRTATVDTHFIAPTNPVEDVSSSFEVQDSQGWFGQMENFSSKELEFLSDLVGDYLETEDDLTQPEWAFARATLDKVDAALEVANDS